MWINSFYYFIIHRPSVFYYFNAFNTHCHYSRRPFFSHRHHHHHICVCQFSNLFFLSIRINCIIKNIGQLLRHNKGFRFTYNVGKEKNWDSLLLSIFWKELIVQKYNYESRRKYDQESRDEYDGRWWLIVGKQLRLCGWWI